MHTIPYRTFLTEEEMPKYWYNLRADMPQQHEPLLNPGTLEPVTKEELSQIFCTALVEQELNTTDRHIPIPQPVLEYYKTYRPSPLIRAYGLEKQLQTPAKIYYKFEGGNTSGSHKLNSAVPQVYYALAQGITHLTTETGAGQWGTALSMACAHFGVDLRVYMVKASAQQKPQRRAVIETFGAQIFESPSNTTQAGRAILEQFPGTGGSLGCAISEAVEAAVTTKNCRYVLGSVLDQVLLHQAIIGSECRIAMDKLGEQPDIVIGCAGGGSNLGGVMSEYMGQKLRGENNIKFIAVEPAACPSLTRGRYAYDFCDAGRITPLAKMYTLGSGFMPASIHAGGLRYHGMSPMISKLYHDGHIDEARALPQTQCFEAAQRFAVAEGILPAPESSHAICAAIQEAEKCKEEGVSRTILFNLTGTGYFDLAAYSQYTSGKMEDFALSEEDLQRGLESLNQIGANR